MGASTTKKIIDDLRRARADDEAGRSDGELLESFIRDWDGDAFAHLVHRHGAMVWGVCGRALADCHDREDAFQAVFLVLLRKASSVRPREMVANWLHGVAYNIAIKVRAMNARRRAREKPLGCAAEPAAASA